MSGIYGIYNKVINENQMIQVLSQMKRWNLAYGDGKNEEAIFSESGMGICMDHITKAPISSKSVIRSTHYVATLDVILYNRRELMEMYGLTDSLSDEELLMKLIILEGYEILAKINGDFSGAVYDTEKDDLVLFRDHLGVRPLYYYKSMDWMGFSTDLRGIVAIPGFSAEISSEYLYRDVCGYDTMDYDATELKDVYEVKPASFLRISIGENGLNYEENVYWKLGTKKICLHSEKDYANKMRDLITEAVKRRLDVFPDRIGAELSGGLDSGVIDILINRMGREATYYSWSYSPKDLPFAENDERLVIADICEQEGIRCEYGNMTMDMGPNSNVGKSHTAIGLEIDLEKQPKYNYAFPLYINTEIVCETAELMQKAGAKVVFSGHSGDEGVSHRCNPYELFYHGEYYHFFWQVWKQIGKQKHHFIRTVRQCFGIVKRGRRTSTEAFMINERAPQILKQEFKEQFQDKKMPILAFSFDSIQYIYSGNTHNRPDITALLGAYSGARYIFPYLDFNVIDYAVSIPRYLYLDGKQNRAIFRKAFKDIMPKSLYEVTAKMNPSMDNVKEDNTDWFEKLISYRDFLYEAIDRKRWEKYLDFDVIEQWKQSEEPGEEEKEAYLNVFRKLEHIYQFQNMVDLVKGLE